MADQGQTRARPVAAGAVGGLIEWYDFAIYGILSPTIARKFFPADDPVGALLATFGVFAIGFAARPLGALLFGYVGDRFGRRTALLASIFLMGTCTFLMAILPTFSQIGLMAPVLLTLLRVAQGLSVGGEFSGAAVYLAEHAPADRRGRITSYAELATAAGFLLGAGVGAASAGLLGEAAMADWGWRIPFALGGVLAIAILFVRRNMPESPAAEIARAAAEPPIAVLFRDHWRTLVHLTALVMFGAVAFYIAFVYSTSFIEGELKYSTGATLDLNVLGMLACLVAIFVSGRLTDRIGRRPVFLAMGVLAVLTSWPFFYLMHHENPWLLGLGQAGFGVLVGGVYAIIPATIAELFPADVRCSGAALGYNICLGLLGGTAPILATWLVATTGDPLSPAWYLTGAAALMIVGGLSLREWARVPLRA